MSSARAFAGMLFLCVSLAPGCIENDVAVFHVPSPHLGESFRYIGSDGTLVNMTLVSLREARDASLVRHETLKIRYDVVPASHPDQTISVFDDVDLATGLSVRQILPCVYNRSPGEWIDCDPMLSLVLYEMSGLPGALGAAPFWMNGELPHGGSIEAHSLFYGLSRLDISSEGIAEECRRFHYSRPGESDSEVEKGAWFPTTVLFQTSTYCSGTPVPMEWTPSMHFSPSFTSQAQPTFRLDGWGKTTGSPIPMGGPNLWSDEGAISLATGVPLLLDEGTATPFTSPEAYRQAQKMDPIFNAAAAKGARVVANEFQSGGGVFWDDVGYRDDWYLRKLGILAENSSIYTISMRKSVRTLHGEPVNESYDVIDREWTTAPALPDEAFQSPSADPQAALRILSGEQTEAFKITQYGFVASYLDPMLPYAKSPYRTDGHQMGFVAIADDEDNPVPGTAVGHKVIIDGPTGVLLRMNIPPDQVERFE